MLKGLIILQIVVCIFLVFIVLFQFGKGAETGSFSNSSFGPAPSKINFMTKITALLVIIFMANSLAITRIQAKESQKSILD